MLASQGGGRCLITWGAVIFGGYQLLKGFSELFSAVGWKRSKRAVFTVAAITLILGVIGIAVLDENALGGTPSVGGDSSPNVVSSNSLKMGDCFRDPGISDFIGLTLIPCTETNGVLRVIGVFTAPDSSTYPGAVLLGRYVSANCPSTTTEYLYPTSESWRAGDRVITCLIAQ